MQALSLMFESLRQKSKSTKVLHSPQTFPPELINQIINELDMWNDRATILACALVSPSFRYFSQQRIFGGITLSTQHVVETNALYTLLYKNSDLSSHIRRLSLYCTGPEEGHDEGFGGDLLPDVLMELRNVVSLNFSGNDWDTNSWECLNPPAQKTLTHLARSGTVTTVSFDGVKKWPAGFLCHFPYLKCIRVEGASDSFVVGGTSDELTEAGLAEPRLELEELQLKWSHSYTLLSCIGTSHPGLRRLVVYSADAACTSMLEELIRSSAKSLEKLKVYHDNEADTDAGLSGDVLGGLTNLRRFSVEGYNLDACKSIIALLKDTIGMYTVEKISIELYGVDVFSPGSDAVWEELNKCLTQHLKFPQLRSVRIFLQTSASWWRAPSEEDTEHLERFLNTLSCIQANPLVFDVTGNSPKFFGHVSEEDERSAWYRLRLLVLGQ